MFYSQSSDEGDPVIYLLITSIVFGLVELFLVAALEGNDKKVVILKALFGALTLVSLLLLALAYLGRSMSRKRKAYQNLGE